MAIRKPKPPTKKEARKLDEIRALIDSGQVNEALMIARSLAKSSSNLIEVWDYWVEIGAKTDNYYLTWYGSRELVKMEPDDPAHYFNAIMSALYLGMTYEAYEFINLYDKCFPIDGDNDNLALYENVDIDGRIAKMRTAIMEQLESNEKKNAASEKPITVSHQELAIFDRGRILVTYGEYAEGRTHLTQIIKAHPEWIPPRNNLALGYFMQGDYDKAQSVIEENLTIEPRDYFALCMRIQFVMRRGQFEEAHTLADALLQDEPKDQFSTHKLIETLAHLERYEDIVARYEQIDPDHLFEHDPDSIQTRHLAAVAYVHSGQPDKARAEWKKIPRHSHLKAIANANLSDLKKPVGEQNGAWPFDLQYWILPDWLEQLYRALEIGAKRDDKQTAGLLEKLTNRLPYLLTACQILLRCGSPDGREFVLHMAQFIPVPGLVDFALGQMGTDAQRIKAAQFASQHDLIKKGQTLPVYVKGKQTEIISLNFEIYSGTIQKDYNKTIMALLAEIHETLMRGRFKSALEAVDEALAKYDHVPSFWNYKQVALTQLNRQEEAKQNLEAMLQRFPDYFFARIEKANLLNQEGQLDEAQDILSDLMQADRLHTSEFVALASIQIQVLMARGETEGAKQWLTLWQDAVPGSVPPEVKRMVESGGKNIWQRLANIGKR